MSYDFTNEGYLAPDDDRLISITLAVAPDLFDRAKQINRDLHSLLFQFPINRVDKRQLLIASSSTRTLEYFQAAVLLLSRRMVASGQSTTRSLLESAFLVRALATDEQFADQYIHADLKLQQKMANKVVKNSYEVFDTAREEVDDELLADIQAEIELHGATSFSTEDLSRKAGMHDSYVSLYALYSVAAHNHVRSMDGYLETDQSGQIGSVSYSPQPEEIPPTLANACWIAVTAIGSAARFHGLPTAALADHRAWLNDHLDQQAEKVRSARG